MSCQDYETQIGEYVDGTLDGSALDSFEAHLATCASCRALVADFTVIREASLSLEPQVPPPHVWTKLSAAIEAEPPSFASLLGGDRSWWRVFAPVAASIVLVAGLTWTGMRLAAIPGDAERLANNAPIAAPEPPATIAAEYQLAEQQLRSTIEGLERIAAQDRNELDMETRDVLQANLTVLDGAIGDSRDALQKEPENDVAQESLFDALRNKVALLQDTIALINEMRKGNQEGAARIVSGLNQ
jgi:hypothetical protein